MVSIVRENSIRDVTPPTSSHKEFETEIESKSGVGYGGGEEEGE